MQVSSRPVLARHICAYTLDMLVVKYTTTGQVVVTYGELADDVSDSPETQRDLDTSSALARKDSIRIGITM
jgi:hypothetical protein